MGRKPVNQGVPERTALTVSNLVAAMLRVVADTNIYISAFNFGGVADRILQEAQKDAFVLFVSPAILAEVQDVLTRKFKWSENRTNQAIRNILGFAQLVNPEQRLNVIKADPADDRILECAVAADADLIVTGDKLLQHVQSFRGTMIVSPSQFFGRTWIQEAA